MNAPFLLMAQLTGRFGQHRAPSRLVPACCLVAAAGVVALSRAGASTPFVLTAAGYVLAGAGFGVLVPAVTHVAMRDVPPGVSGAASGVVNASRQIGTSVGLAVLGSLGVTAAVSAWHSDVARLPATTRHAAVARLPDVARHAAAQQAQNVAGARIGAVTRALGPGYRDAAVRAFVHGYHLAVGTGAVCLLAAAAVALIGFRRARPAPPAQPVGGTHEQSRDGLNV
jgi:hypothetical protein